MNDIKITKDLLQKHNISDSEYQMILDSLSREPTFTELGIFSAMYSEHCSYKSTKKWLKELYTNSKDVICGPGENAGIIDLGDDDALVFKMESHNHPSYIEPYQGAATGVGGILRDIFTMGARPIALVNSLHFGEITKDLNKKNNSKTKYLLNGVVKGISNYGNSIGIPTIMSNINFHKSYNKNNLVNAMAIGVVNKNKIFYSTASHIDSIIIYAGAKTGKDGINGAVMASHEFSKNDEDKRPNVQVGDPFLEKLLMEACLELMKEDAILSIQDMGAAGLTSSSFEMSGKGNVGMELYLDKVPLREKNMIPYEIMLSETQERMLMTIKNNKEDIAKKIFNKYNIDCSSIGKITKDPHVKIYMNGKEYANIKSNAFIEKSPEYDREWI